MTIRRILFYPDPKLHEVTPPVTKFDADLKKTVDDMFETMYQAHGAGLAGPQIGYMKRVLVLDASRNETAPQAFINPEIIYEEGRVTHQEGCLSMPGIWVKVERAAKIRVRAQDVTGKTFEVEGEGLLSRCLQHEIDHLDGRLFVDDLSKLKLKRVEAKMAKYRRNYL